MKTQILTFKLVSKPSNPLSSIIWINRASSTPS